MKLLSFSINDRATFGVLDGESVVDLAGEFRTLSDFLAADGVARLKAGRVARHEAFPLKDIRFLPVVADPAKILCVGFNYSDKQTEMGKEKAKFPTIFLKHSSAVVAHEDRIVRPKASEHFDYEGELAVVIGRGGRYISQDQALAHVAGYTCFNDVTVRDFVPHSVFAGKNFPNSSGLGPWMTTTDEIPDPTQLTLRTRLNGTEVQHTSITALVFSIPELIAYCSKFMQLNPGDIIATGSPAGVGAKRSPPLWLRPGDSVEVEVSNIGVLRNAVVDEV